MHCLLAQDTIAVNFVSWKLFEVTDLGKLFLCRSKNNLHPVDINLSSSLEITGEAIPTPDTRIKLADS